MTDELDRQMQIALDQAREAQQAGDHPYGAVIITPQGTQPERNRVVTATDPTAHSEVMAIRTAAQRWGLEGLPGSTLITSFEPCPMCLGAIVEAGVEHLVIAVRREVGEAPLGDYTVEALLALMGAGDRLKVTEGVGGPDAEAFYATVD